PVLSGAGSRRRRRFFDRRGRVSWEPDTLSGRAVGKRSLPAYPVGDHNLGVGGDAQFGETPGHAFALGHEGLAVVFGGALEANAEAVAALTVDIGAEMFFLRAAVRARSDRDL